MAENSNNLINVVKAVPKFSGKDPARFDEWHNNTCISLNMFRRGVFNIIRGQTRPTTADDTANGTLLQAEYDRCNEELFAILHLATEQPASLLVRKHEDASGLSGNGYNSYQELVTTYKMVTDEKIRAKTEELAAINIRLGQDPTTYFQEAGFLRDELECMGEPVTERRFKSILIQGMTEEFKDVRFATYRDTAFDLAQIEKTMRNVYLDNLSRRKATAGRIAGRGIAMAAHSTPGLSDTTCYDCKGIGHYSYDCPSPLNSGGDSNENGDNHDNHQTGRRKGGQGSKSKQGSGDGGGQKWCSLHNSTTHNDADCHTQKYVASSADIIGTHSSTDFEDGFSWMATCGRSFQANSHTMTMLVDSGATEHFLDDELIPGLKDILLDYELLDNPKKIAAAGQRVLLGTATGVLPDTITNQNGGVHKANFRIVIVSGLGRHLFSSSAGMVRGIATNLEPGYPRPKKGDIVVPLQQPPADNGLCTFDVDISAERSVQ